MSTNEFVVIQVWQAYVHGSNGVDIGFHGRWLDYSRCSAAEALSFLPGKPDGRFRPVHWIGKEAVLSERQLLIMARHSPSQWANAPAPDGDHWTVDVVWHDGPASERVQVRFVGAWTGEPWRDLIEDLAAESAESGETVVSLKLH